MALRRAPSPLRTCRTRAREDREHSHLSLVALPLVVDAEVIVVRVAALALDSSDGGQLAGSGLRLPQRKSSLKRPFPPVARIRRASAPSTVIRPSFHSGAPRTRTLQAARTSRLPPVSEPEASRDNIRSCRTSREGRLAEPWEPAARRTASSGQAEPHEVTLRGSSGYQARHPCRLIPTRWRSSLSSAPTTASTDRVRLAGASRAATAVRTVANRRGPVVAADAASPPCFPARSGAKRGGVDIAVPRGVKLGDQFRPPDSERSLDRDGTRPALPLATTSARRATVPDRSRGDQRLPLMPARTASPPHPPA